VVGQYLGGAAPAPAAPAPAKKPKPEREASPTLFMDEEGHVHLGVHPGDDRELFEVLRRVESEEAQAAARDVARAAPVMAEARRAARAAGRREPRLERTTAPRASKRVATHAYFQPRRHN
jgi:hypothetical protein